MYLARKYQARTPCLRLLKTGPPFYVVIRATRRSSRLWGKDSSSYFKTLSIVPALVMKPATSRFAVNPAGVRRTCSVSSVSGHRSGHK